MNDQRDHDRNSTFQEMADSISRIEVKLFGFPGQEYDGWIPRTDVRLGGIEANLKEKLAEHGKRLAWVETKIWMWMGAIAVIVFAAERMFR